MQTTAAKYRATVLTHRGPAELRYVPAFAAGVIAVWLVPGLGVAMFVGLAMWAVSSDRRAIEAITLAWLISTLNPEIYSYPSAGLRWLVLLAAAGGLIVRRSPRSVPTWIESYPSLLVFSILVVLTSFLSDFPGLSLSKLIGFLVGVFVILMVFRSRDVDSTWLNAWLVSLGVTVAIVSLPLTFVPLGYVTNNRGFQGILNHPQALGVFLAVFVAYFAARILAGATVLPYTALASGFCVMLILTQARTGVLAAAAGVGAATVVVLAGGRRSGDVVSRSRAVAGVFVALALVFVAISLGASGDISDFLTKGRSASLVESIEISRGGQIETFLERFGESPLVGSGFGISASLDPSDVEAVAGIPVGAPVESGFAVTGLLEQTGLLGAVAFVWYLIQVITPVARHPRIASVALVVAGVASNVGEATITSFGGMGLFVWLMIGWALILGKGRSIASLG